MGNCVSLPANISSKKKKKNPFPIDTMFKLPSPIPTWPPGEGFASGTIDLGELSVSQTSSFTKIWSTQEGGPDNNGATFFEPSSIQEGFFSLGCYSQSNNKPLHGWVLVAKENVPNDYPLIESPLKLPIDYTLVWTSESLKIKQDGHGYIWLPMPPEGYKSVGYVVTNSPEKPSGDKIRCVRSDLTDVVEIDAQIWSQNGFNVYGSQPVSRGTQAMGVATGTFIVQNGSSDVALFCLRNVKTTLSAMPNLPQIDALIQAYSPRVYFHPDETFLPSSVNWYFRNGALLYKRGEESKPVPIEPNGLNLPQGGSNDGEYWLDLPAGDSDKERVKKGDLQEVEAYFHIKPMFGGTFTDIAIWLFYPFNGPARAKVEFVNISLGKIGEHVGDWEHLTLRVSNFNGELTSVYFSEHSAGKWVNATDLEFENANKPVSYASLHGHAFYSKPGLVLQGSGGIGIRNDTAKSKMVMDTGIRSMVVAAEYLGSTVVEPPWLNYYRDWGPKISYDIAEEISKVERVLPGILKKAFEKFVRGIPNEVLGEEGPTGPKVKNNWSGDEKVKALGIYV